MFFLKNIANQQNIFFAKIFYKKFFSGYLNYNKKSDDKISSLCGKEFNFRNSY